MTSCAWVISPADRRYTGWMLSAAARRRASVRARSTNSTVRDAVTSLGLTQPSRSCSLAGRYCAPVTRVRAIQVVAPMATFRDGASAMVHGRRSRGHIVHYYSGTHGGKRVAGGGNEQGGGGRPSPEARHGCAAE